MSSHSSIDRESFQTFLANAFAVQESGLGAESVAALIEIQHFIARGDFDLDGAMSMIAERALKVCSASGVGIALLEGNELVYRSGSGCAAQDIRRRVPAVLSICSPRELREILRVENARTDTRIEAHICRQFGGVALLMLPIWKDGLLAGVLQVVFEDAHPFDEREVRTYRLMVGALEYGMSQRAHKPEVVNPLAAVSAERVEPQCAESAASIAAGTAILAATGAQFLSQSQVAGSNPGTLAESGDEIFSDDPMIRDRASGFWWALTSSIRTAVGRLWGANFWNAGAALGAAIVLSVSVWIFHRTHLSNPQIEMPTPALRDASAGTAVKPQSGNGEPKGSGLSEEKVPNLGGDWKGTEGSVPRFMRVRVGPNEVDYIADDVTIRQFDTRSPKARTKSGIKQVDFGDDVTVRYFANVPLPVSQPSTSAQPSPPNNQGSLPAASGRQE